MITTRTEQLRFELDDGFQIQHTDFHSDEVGWQKPVEEDCADSVASWTSIQKIEDCNENQQQEDWIEPPEVKAADAYNSIPWENPLERNKALVMTPSHVVMLHATVLTSSGAYS